MMKTKSPLLRFAITIAKKAGTLILKESTKKLHITEKGKNDLVTNVDKASEKLIIREIKKAYPNHAILAEESAAKSTKKSLKNSLKDVKYIWLVDPLDGTTNFAHGLYQYCVSIALLKITNDTEGELIVGVIFAPALNQLFYAEKGKGAYFQNGKNLTKKIHVSKIKKVSESLLVTGFPPTNRELSLKYFSKMMFHCQAIRRLGSAALDLCYTAAGMFDGHWEFGLKPWDIAAGSLIVTEAGGIVTDTKGNLLNLSGQDLLASNRKIHEEMIEIFKEIGSSQK